ncbi:hypothetical protein [Clavibacter michiganensis]|uniref:hypothetical protein n=1 Tax=Clavibacter michiganensis TaxID=28447 RepID=UPI000CE884DF|nr:hypothetical protein [Clavibacter michiganensis]
MRVLTAGILAVSLVGCSDLSQPSTDDAAPTPTADVPAATATTPPAPISTWEPTELAAGEVYRLNDPTPVGTMTVTRTSEKDLVFHVEGIPELTTRAQLRVYAGEHDPFDGCLPERFDRVFPMGTFGDIASAGDVTRVTWDGAEIAPEVLSGEYVDAQITDFIDSNVFVEGGCVQPTIAFAHLRWN